MTESAIKREVKKQLIKGGAIWKDGLGFSANGWDYTIDEDGCWEASPRNGEYVIGKGDSPNAARENAAPVSA